MELDGGSLESDPLTGRLILNRHYILDCVNRQLIDRTLPFRVSASGPGEKTEISSNAAVLYSGYAAYLGGCLLRSGSYFAYALRPDASSLAAKLFAVFSGDLKPVKVAAGTYSPARPIGWIE